MPLLCILLIICLILLYEGRNFCLFNSLLHPKILDGCIAQWLLNTHPLMNEECGQERPLCELITRKDVSLIGVGLESGRTPGMLKKLQRCHCGYSKTNKIKRSGRGLGSQGPLAWGLGGMTGILALTQGAGKWLEVLEQSRITTAYASKRIFLSTLLLRILQGQEQKREQSGGRCNNQEGDDNYLATSVVIKRS